jgi:hypothetical protein
MPMPILGAVQSNFSGGGKEQSLGFYVFLGHCALALNFG